MLGKIIRLLLLALALAACQNVKEEARTRMRPVFSDCRLLAEGIKSKLSTAELRVLRAKVATDLSESCSEPSLRGLSAGVRGVLLERCAAYEKVAEAYSLLVEDRALRDVTDACIAAHPSTLPHYTADLADLDEMAKISDCVGGRTNQISVDLARRKRELGFISSKGEDKEFDDFAASALARAEDLFWSK